MNSFAQTFFSWPAIVHSFPRLLAEGLRNTLLIALLAILVGIVIGTPLARMLLSQRWWLRLPARVYLDVFRGLLVVIPQAIRPILPGLASQFIRDVKESAGVCYLAITVPLMYIVGWANRRGERIRPPDAYYPMPRNRRTIPTIAGAIR